ncbi:MAG: ribose transport system ATP-binding protein [Gammaproteobacteria bacterium]|jgi:ribose transport system ATP-binding protein
MLRKCGITVLTKTLGRPQVQSLTFTHMSKTYGDVAALSDVSLSLHQGRVHALMGENGAGKSTLIKLIAGVVKADNIVFAKDGKTFPLDVAQDAHDAGFRFIHQELNIIPQVSVAENILLGSKFPRRFGLAIDWRKLRAKASAALSLLGATHIDVTAIAADLSAGDKMLIRIAAALVADDNVQADLYVLDEPTAALTDKESEMLFEVINTLKANGAAVLYVSHRMDEVLRICDDVTVLRDGHWISTKPIADTSKGEIIHAMTGRDVKDAYPSRITPVTGSPLLIVDNVKTRTLSDIQFSLKKGEILGVAGLAEAGQSELLNLFMGLEKVESGSAQLDGKTFPKDPSQAWLRKIAYIPRERRTQSLMLNVSIRSNIVLPHLRRYGAVANLPLERREALTGAEKVGLKYDSLEQPVGQLSGGNQQKVVFARALQANPAVLLLDEPTRGVDVGSKFDIYTIVRALSAQGCIVILTSSDLTEMLGMCDRILVLNQGRQTHSLDRGELSSAELLAHFYV